VRDLIARVVAEHQIYACASTWHCRCGVKSDGEAPWQQTQGQRRRSRADCDLHVADAILATLEDSQPDHLIDLTGDGLDVSWVIRHSMACRLAGRLFDCPYNRAAVAEMPGGPWPTPGRYRCALNDYGRLVIGEAVPA